MLTLAKVTSAEAAVTYYEESDDYYAEGGRAPSGWWGKGASALGLEGQVETADFKQLLEGKLPTGDKPHRGGEGPRMAGLDLTFSAPKSVSLQVLVGGDRRLLDAHEAAVTTALRYVESNLAAYRLTMGGETMSMPSGNVLAARFDHDLSRDEDPQLHTHCVLLNLTQRPDGQWRALDAKPVFKQQKLLGAHYRAELAAAVQALGYRVRRTHEDGRFELAHISDAHVEAFSTRRRAIDAALTARGHDRHSASAREREIAGLSTRRGKDETVDREALAQAWKVKAEGLGICWSPLAPVTLSETEREAAAAEAVDFAVAHLAERCSIVPQAKVAHVALAHGTGAVVLDEVQREVDRRVAVGELIASADGRHFTTAAAQTLEREMLAIEERGRSALRLGIRDRRYTRTMLSGPRLTDGQRAAAELILTTRHRFVGVQGLAGTGKTWMLRQVKANLGMVFKPVGLAPSAAAARELESSGIPSMTVAAFLARNASGLDMNSVVVLDEAGMVSARDMQAVLLAVEKVGARAVLVGDTRQLKAVEAGAPFAQLQRAGMETARMADIQRQTNPALRDAVLDAAEGRTAASVAKLASKIAEVPHATERYERIARHYACLLPADREETLVVAGTNGARSRINELVRQRLGLTGEGLVVKALERRDMTRAQMQSSLSYLPGDIVEMQRHYESLGLRRGDTARVIGAEPGCITLQRGDGAPVTWRPTAMPHVAVYSEVTRELAVGDVVRFTANDYPLGIVNGQTGRVELLDATTGLMAVRTGKGELVNLDTNKALHLDHGYCTTVHAAQGRTCERVLVDADVSSAMANESLYYVAISRARSEVSIYTDDRSILPDAMARLDEKPAALDLDRPTTKRLAMAL